MPDGATHAVVSQSEEENRLLEKLRRIEALFAGATTLGEREAAASASKVIKARLDGLVREDPPIEFRFTLGDSWSRKVFAALCRRYGIQPYRYHGQRYTTLNARVSKRFVDETLWPEFEQITQVLHQHLNEVTERIIAQAIHTDVSEAQEIARPKGLEDKSDA